MSLFFNMNESGRIETIKGKWASDEYRIPAGTPISANGEIANNGNAVGILVSEARLRRTYPLSIAHAIEVKSPKGRFDYEYRVITAGFVNKTEAEKEYGEAYTAEAKSAMKNINFVDETNPNSLGGSGGAKSWNDLEDRPFGEEVTNLGDTVTWDLVLTENAVVKDMGGGAAMCFQHMTDCIPTVEECVGSTFTALSLNGEVETHEVTSDMITPIDNGYMIGELQIVVATESNVVVEAYGMVLPKKGVYFACATMNGVPMMYTNSITIPNYEFVTSVVKKIDPKYLPDGIGYETVGVSDTITWDGVKGDVYSEAEVNLSEATNLLFNFISDSTPNFEDLVGSTVIASSAQESHYVYTVTEEVLHANGDILMVGAPDAFFPIALIVYKAGAEWNAGQATLVFPQKGVYFIKMSAVDDGAVILICESLTIPNYEFTTTVVKKIDPKYLPDDIGGGFSLPVVEISTEPLAPTEGGAALTETENAALNAAWETGLPVIYKGYLQGAPAVAVLVRMDVSISESTHLRTYTLAVPGASLGLSSQDGLTWASTFTQG